MVSLMQKQVKRKPRMLIRQESMRKPGMPALAIRGKAPIDWIRTRTAI